MILTALLFIMLLIIDITATFRGCPSPSGCGKVWKSLRRSFKLRTISPQQWSNNVTRADCNEIYTIQVSFGIIYDIDLYLQSNCDGNTSPTSYLLWRNPLHGTHVVHFLLGCQIQFVKFSRFHVHLEKVGHLWSVPVSIHQFGTLGLRFRGIYT